MTISYLLPALLLLLRLPPTSIACFLATTTPTATTTTTYFVVYGIGNRTTKWDNVSVVVAEEDRSVNNNSLQAFGTITKGAVATGADLVGYQNTTGAVANYLMQPYNSGMNFGTDAFSVTWWMKITGDISGAEYVYDRQGGNAN